MTLWAFSNYAQTVLELVVSRARDSNTDTVDHSEVGFTVSDALVAGDDKSWWALLNNALSIDDFFERCFALDKNALVFRKLKSWGTFGSDTFSILVGVVLRAFNLDTFAVDHIPSSRAIGELALAVNKLVASWALDDTALSISSLDGINWAFIDSDALVVGEDESFRTLGNCAEASFRISYCTFFALFDDAFTRFFPKN